MVGRIAIFGLLIAALLQASAQSEWEEDRKPFDIEDGEKEYALQYLYRAVDYDYKYDENSQFVCDITYHEIMKVTNDDGLESVNRIYIPMGNVIEVLDIRSRTISNEGKIIELDENNIKEIEDEEEKGGYRIFAVEGAEVGGEIEYRYVKRVHGSTFINEKIQFTSPVKEFEFSLTCPENLEFEFSIANDTAQVVQTDTTDGYNKYEVRFADIPEYYAESFSGYDANKKRIDFKLAYNSAKGKKRVNTFSDAGKKIFERAKGLSKSEQKLVDEFIKEFDISSLKPIERLKKLEHEAKKKFYAEEYVSDDLEYLFTNGFGSKRALAKLYLAIVDFLGLDYELVVTSSRFETKFDPTFDSWNYLDDYLLYFPSEDQFLAVHSYTDRYGYVPSSNTATQGIFIKPELITDFIYPVTRIDYIPELPYTKNLNNLDIRLQFDETLSKTELSVKRIYIGSEANYYKSALYWMDQEQKDEMLDDLVQYLSPDAEIEEVIIEEANNDYNNWNKPFILSTKFETEGYIEQAGNSILLKVGDLIGAQSELYQEEERVFEVENSNNRGYLREISITVPEGYSVQNAEDIIITEKVYNEEDPIFLFESSYEMQGNELKIKIEEFYNQIYYPKEKFEDFRKVINAAADWNKVVLVLKEG